MKHQITLALATLAFLAGCAATPQMPISLTADTVAEKSGRIGVAMTPLPKVDTYFPGAGCLLCLATASLANSSLTTYTQKLAYEDLPQLKVQIADALRKKGADVVIIDEDIKLDAFPNASSKGPNVSKKDFSSLRGKYKVDRLLLISIGVLGVERTYSAYIPTSDPKVVLRGTGYLVNLSSQAYEWYQPVNVQKSSDGPWNEPPKFPGLTNAYFQAIELGKDAFMQPFAR